LCAHQRTPGNPTKTSTKGHEQTWFELFDDLGRARKQRRRHDQPHQSCRREVDRQVNVGPLEQSWPLGRWWACLFRGHRCSPCNMHARSTVACVTCTTSHGQEPRHLYSQMGLTHRGGDNTPVSDFSNRGRQWARLTGVLMLSPICSAMTMASRII